MDSTSRYLSAIHVYNLDKYFQRADKIFQTIIQKLGLMWIVTTAFQRASVLTAVDRVFHFTTHRIIECLSLSVNF